MKNIKINSIIIILLMIVMNACEKEEVAVNETGSFTLSFENVVGNNTLVLNNENYINGNGDTFNVTMFKYYISNVQLIKEDGSLFTYPKEESYFLVKAEDELSKTITLNNIPTGNYKGATFTLGIDSLTNVEKPITERTGVLSATENMYWVWNSGYIFLKLEGTSPQIPEATNANHAYKFHIGGFGGYSSSTINNIKTISLTSTNPASIAVVKGNKTTDMHIMVDVLEIFDNPTTVNLANTSTVMFAPYSVNIANNYVNMFSLDHFHNPN